MYDIVEHTFPAFVIKVNINIRHCYPFRIQETLKKKVVLYGVNIGDPGAKGYSRACSRAPSGPYEHLHPACFGNEVLYYEKVAGKSHFPDHGKFKVKPFADLPAHLRIQFFRSFIGQVPEIIIFGIKSFR